MQRQQSLPFADRRAHFESWTRLAKDQRMQVTTLLAELIVRAVRAMRIKELRDDATEK